MNGTSELRVLRQQLHEQNTGSTATTPIAAVYEDQNYISRRVPVCIISDFDGLSLLESFESATSKS